MSASTAGYYRKAKSTPCWGRSELDLAAPAAVSESDVTVPSHLPKSNKFVDFYLHKGGMESGDPSMYLHGSAWHAMLASMC